MERWKEAVEEMKSGEKEERWREVVIEVAFKVL